MQKLLIFDWGRTLYDPETKDVFSDVPRMLRGFRERYDMAIVCLATDGDFERRTKVMKESGIENLFSRILMNVEDKDSLYERALSDLGYSPAQTIIIDDRTIRGIRWGNAKGATTIWLKRGKFSNELPTEQTGIPNHTITEITQLVEIL